ncbi:hypothetical protein G4P69_36655 [Aetokthonos hydrillicola CCALA 1050]|nr:hypothetical protein [Aetokthonos hydrillicola CCALA 1050]
MLTSRVKCFDTTAFEGKERPVRVFPLQGLGVTDIQELLTTKGTFKGTPNNWDRLIDSCAGNPYVVNRIASTIQQLFDGSISEFLKHKITIFNDLNPEYELLSDAAKATIQCMVLNRQPISFSQLRTKMPPSVSSQELLEALELLQARAWIDTKTGLFAVQPMVVKYVESFLIDKKITKFQPRAFLEQEHQPPIAK